MTLNERATTISIFLCGDVMTGRGIDQVLPYPNDPVLYEPGIQDAREYVRLAEATNGPIRRPVDLAYIWGDALPELERAAPHLRIINLETSVTSCQDAWPNKGINYRMHPRNIGCLQAANVDCCCLANNHMLDWGYAGLAETLRTLDQAGIAHAGAGRSRADAAAPAIFDIAGKGRVLVFSFGSTTSGVVEEWGATNQRAGVNLLPDLSEETAYRVATALQRIKRRGDVAIASMHWGSNWGYDVSDEQVSFAHKLVDDGFDIIHGHSSHHVRPIELYRDRLIMYGCGDFIDDYEGIGGYEAFRGDLKLMYLIDVDPSAETQRARLVPMRMIRFRLTRVSDVDSQWLCDLLTSLGSRFRTRVELEGDGSLNVRPAQG